MSDEDLPVVLVSAADVATATAVIDELTESSEGGSERIWEISNKYYSARVRVRAAGDAAPPPAAPHPAPRVEAHLVHLAADECTVEKLSERAAAATCGGVRLALCACAEGALRAGAQRLRIELVALQDVAADSSAPAAPFPELRGWARAREALHAHVWPGLQPALTGLAPLPPHTDEDEESGDSEHGEDSEEWEPEECVRRAEMFARALGALEAARGAPAGAPGGGAPAGAQGEGAQGEGGAERLLRAEQILAAFCAALGTDIDDL